MFIKRNLLLLTACTLLTAFGATGYAAEIPQEWKQNLLLKFEYRHFTLNLAAQSNQNFFIEKNSLAASEDAAFGENTLLQVESSDEAQALDTPTKTTEWALNRAELENFLREYIAPQINQPVSDVTISRDEEGDIVFDGHGDFGWELDIARSLVLIETAVYNGLDKVTLAVKKTNPTIAVTDPELEKQGIGELLSIGWSIFDGSPYNRRHNIDVGRNRFNGYLIPQGEIFSFNEQLGAVNGATGYLKELVIVGQTTVPEYGGGLCQVSSTTYRGAMIGGFPIAQRRNHSYSVRYYFPQGTDATIYPPAVDFKFENDTPGAVLIQTRVDGDNLYFHYYGTKDDRKTYALGPYISRYIPAPPDRNTTSTNIPVGSVQQLSGRHDGMDVSWYRLVEKPVDTRTASNEEMMPEQKTEQVWQSFFSRYQARGNWYVRGVAAEQEPTATETGAGDWIGE